MTTACGLQSRLKEAVWSTDRDVGYIGTLLSLVYDITTLPGPFSLTAGSWGLRLD